MFEFLNWGLIGGLAAVAAPVLIHLSHRRHAKQFTWGAMRFLEEMLAKSRRRLQLDEWLLLLVRTALVLALALALMRPAWRRGSMSMGANVARQGRAAAVLLIDDSVSTATGRSRSALEDVKELALAYLSTLESGDEICLLTRSGLAAGVGGEVLFDVEAVKTKVKALQPTSFASDMPALLEAGMTQLGRMLNPGGELVLAYDGRRDGWHTEQKARWEECRSRLLGPATARLGSRQRPQLMILTPAQDTLEGNLAVTDVHLDRTLVTVGQEVVVRATVRHEGALEPHGVVARLLVDGRSVEERQVIVTRGQQVEVTFRSVFREEGEHALEVVLDGWRDSLPADDRRGLVVTVENVLPVLLLEGREGSGFDSSLSFVAAALDPEGNGRGPFRVTRQTLSQMTPRRLAEFRVVVLGDVAALDTVWLEAIERFVVGGGGIMVGLGGQLDVGLINRTWARAGNGFLPCPLGQVSRGAAPSSPVLAAASHPVFRGFGPGSAEVWKDANVRQWCSLETKAVKEEDLRVLLRLADGQPLMVERRRGLGQVVLWASSLNGLWTDLPIQPAFVPLMRGIVGYLGNFAGPPLNLAVGERAIAPLASRGLAEGRMEGPGGEPISLAGGVWEGRPALVSAPLSQPGIYSLQGNGLVRPKKFAVTLETEESGLQRDVPPVVMEKLGLSSLPIFHEEQSIRRALQPAARRSVELWRLAILGALALLFLESWLTRRQAQPALASSAAAAPDSGVRQHL